MNEITLYKLQMAMKRCISVAQMSANRCTDGKTIEGKDRAFFESLVNKLTELEREIQ